MAEWRKVTSGQTEWCGPARTVSLGGTGMNTPYRKEIQDTAAFVHCYSYNPHNALGDHA